MCTWTDRYTVAGIAYGMSVQLDKDVNKISIDQAHLNYKPVFSLTAHISASLRLPVTRMSVSERLNVSITLAFLFKHKPARILMHAPPLNVQVNICFACTRELFLFLSHQFLSGCAVATWQLLPLTPPQRQAAENSQPVNSPRLRGAELHSVSCVSTQEVSSVFDSQPAGAGTQTLPRMPDPCPRQHCFGFTRQLMCARTNNGNVPEIARQKKKEASLYPC